MRLKEITISGFRGFNKKQTINLENSIVLVKGSNGSGKSSLVEAIEWLFFDEISRKKKSLCKSEYKGEFLRNLHCVKEQETYVELLIEIMNKQIRIKKLLVSPEKKEYYINGSSADNFSSLGINFSEVYKPILSQVEVKHYVETDPKDRYEETNEILGLGVLNELRTDLQELQNFKKAESTYQTYKRNFHGLEGDLNELGFEKLWIGMSNRPFSVQIFQNLLAKTITETYSLGFKPLSELGSALDDEFKKLVQKSDNSEITQMETIQTSSANGSPADLILETRQLFGLIKQLKPIKAELCRFLETGKNLIEDTICPFCQEKTITPEKRKEIDSRIRSTKEAETLLSNVSSKTAGLFELKENFYYQYLGILNTSAIEKIRNRIADKADYSDETRKINSIKEQIVPLEKDVSTLNAKLVTLIDDAKNLSSGKLEFDEDKYETLICQAEELAYLIQKETRKLHEDTQVLLSSIVSKAPSLSEKEKQELKRYFLFKKIIDRFDEIKYVGIYENMLGEVSSLIAEVEKFEKAKSENEMAKLNDTIKMFYAQLNPNEQTQFSEISSKEKNRKIQIKAISYGKDMNPVSCFSEAHMNCLCLSIYFSQRVIDNPYWDFVILDDPVQSMDEDHSKNLIRILDNVHATKQVVIASHNARFCQDFKALFYGRDYLFYEFFGNEVDGPKIDLKQAPFETYVSIAKKYCNGNSEERATSGNNLRKAIERFTADMLIIKGKISYNRTYNMKLEERLEKIEISKLLSLEEIGEIKGMLKICDSASHEHPEREVTSTELLDGVSTLETLFDKHLKVV